MDVAKLSSVFQLTVNLPIKVSAVKGIQTVRIILTDVPWNKLKLTGRNLDQVFNSRLGCVCICRAMACITKRPNLKLKTRPEQLLGSLLLALTFPL